jgi:hypothetical protein
MKAMISLAEGSAPLARFCLSGEGRGDRAIQPG